MFQTIIIVGNVGRDPEMRYTPSGQAVTSFSVATNRQYSNNNGETVKETIWFRVSAWGKTGETCNQYLKKGSKVLIEGRLTADPATGGPRIWNGQDGSPRFLSSRSENEGGSTGSPAPAADVDAPAENEDIPF